MGLSQNGQGCEDPIPAVGSTPRRYPKLAICSSGPYAGFPASQRNRQTPQVGG